MNQAKSRSPVSRVPRVCFAWPFQQKARDRSYRGLPAIAIINMLVALVAPATATAAVGSNVQAVQPDHLSDYWVMTNTSLDVDVPNSGVNLSKPTCSAVTYMIGSDGVTRDIVVRNTIPAGDLKTVAASAVKDMHYVPGANNAARSPVFTYIVIPFNLPADPAARKKITDACVLKDFPSGYR
ncbi:MAG TPA: energy transducer TonB [Rhodanobacteraceae bacterium]|nr:energy transducer TonB [Rhodanobacteraceae bacterium]